MDPQLFLKIFAGCPWCSRQPSQTGMHQRQSTASLRTCGRGRSLPQHRTRSVELVNSDFLLGGGLGGPGGLSGHISIMGSQAWSQLARVREKPVNRARICRAVPVHHPDRLLLLRQILPPQDPPDHCLDLVRQFLSTSGAPRRQAPRCRHGASSTPPIVTIGVGGLDGIVRCVQVGGRIGGGHRVAERRVVVPAGGSAVAGCLWAAYATYES